MLYSRDFVWCHFGKTGGNSVRAMLKALNDENIQGDWTISPWQHESWAAREIRTQEKLDRPTYILSFRRLPTWIASHLNQQFGNAPPTDAIERTIAGQLVLAPQSQGRQIGLFQGIKTLDDLLSYYMPRRPDLVLRQENLVEDFRSAFSRFYPMARIAAIPAEQLNVKDHAQLKQKLLTSEIIVKMYRDSPLWAAWEREVYGGLLRDS